ncbi:MAG: hypothetical protein ACFFG0_43915 [Candidatus Thorarchaeota archaeon]
MAQPKEYTEIKCPHCGKTVVACTDWSGNYPIYFAHCRNCGNYIEREEWERVND